MEQQLAATAFDALGHEARLKLYVTLVRAGNDGLPIGELQQRLDGMPRSTLAHHLGKLASADLVLQRKAGASVITTANYPTMHMLVGYLTDECCIDVSD